MAGYTRNDTPNNIADGNVINASDLDGEFDAIEDAFNGTTGHSHDGSSGAGPQIAAAGIASNAVTTDKILNANVTTDKIADNNITTAKILNANVTTDKIAADAINGTKIADDVIDSEHYVAGSIDAEHLASDSVTTDKILNANVTTDKIADANVTLAKIADQAANTVLVRDANTAGVVSAKAVADTQILIGDGTGFTAAALSGDVTMANTGAVTIANDAVETAMIADSNVTTAKINNGAVTSAKLDTNIQIAGTLGVTGETTLTTHLNMGDNDIIKLGDSADLQIYHDGPSGVSYINESGSGNFVIQGTNLFLNAINGQTYLNATQGGAVNIFHNNSQKIATTATGIDVTGVITTDGMTTSADINFGDNDKAIFGDGSDFQIYFDGTNSIINENVAGNLLIQGDNIFLQNGAASATYLRAVSGGTVELRYSDSPKLATTSTGVDITGDLAISNDVEVTGRSVGVTIEPENDGSFDLSVCNDFTCTTTTATEITFTNAAAGQSGNIKFVNGGNHAITADTMVAINANVLSTLSATGTYHLAYYVTAASGNDTILVSASAALT